MSLCFTLSSSIAHERDPGTQGVSISLSRGEPGTPFEGIRCYHFSSFFAGCEPGTPFEGIRAALRPVSSGTGLRGTAVFNHIYCISQGSQVHPSKVGQYLPMEEFQACLCPSNF